MEVTAEAKHIMIQALGKMYSLRSQRGGLRLHRSLLLTLVMKSARDIYHTAKQNHEPDVTASPMETKSTDDVERSGHGRDLHGPEEPMLEKENCSPTGPNRHSRKRRGKTAAEPDFLPCKKAKLDSGEVRGILQPSQNKPTNCGRQLDSFSHVHMPRAIVTF